MNRALIKLYLIKFCVVSMNLKICILIFIFYYLFECTLLILLWHMQHIFICLLFDQGQVWSLFEMVAFIIYYVLCLSEFIVFCFVDEKLASMAFGANVSLLLYYFCVMSQFSCIDYFLLTAWRDIFVANSIGIAMGALHGLVWVNGLYICQLVIYSG